jgi:GNAT superfamily N-acetyltransferase
MQITRARPEDAAILTAIAFDAKRHWGYPEAWIESWRDVLEISPEFISGHETYVAMDDRCAVGFCALSGAGRRMSLLHLWVRLAAMGRGVGRALFAHAANRTKELGFRALEIESDPNAEGFYLRMGARRIGSRITELDGQRRELPVLIYEIARPT